MRAQDLVAMCMQGGALFTRGAERFKQHLSNPVIDFASIGTVCLDFLALLPGYRLTFVAYGEMLTHLTEAALRHPACSQEGFLLAVRKQLENLLASNEPDHPYRPLKNIRAQLRKAFGARLSLKSVRVESGKQLASLAAGANAWMFSEGTNLSGPAEEAFAGLSDYCSEFRVQRALLGGRPVGRERGTGRVLGEPERPRVCLAAATRSAVLRSQPSAQGVRMDILYVVASPKDAVPENFAVKREIRRG
jgi:hypothetical protein